VALLVDPSNPAVAGCTQDWTRLAGGKVWLKQLSWMASTRRSSVQPEPYMVMPALARGSFGLLSVW